MGCDNPTDRETDVVQRARLQGFSMADSPQIQMMKMMAATRGPKKNDPTVANAVDAFLDHCRMEQTETSFRSMKSVLKGGEKATKKAAGTPLARSHLGQLKTHRATPEDLKRWFIQRHHGLSDDARKRGNAHLTGFIVFCIQRGWMNREAYLARAVVKAGDSPRPWLTPASVTALGEELEALNDPRFDAYWHFSLYVDLETGIRPAEKQDLLPGDLDVRERVLKIRRGKGKGEAKLGRSRSTTTSSWRGVVTLADSTSAETTGCSSNAAMGRPAAVAAAGGSRTERGPAARAPSERCTER